MDTSESIQRSDESDQEWRHLDTPSLLIDLARLEKNIESMAKRAAVAGVALRPHFKTHKSTWIAGLQRASGATGFTVSKLDEAEALFQAGLDDILVATQIVAAPKIRRAIELAMRGRLILAVDGVAGASALSAAAVDAGVVLEVSIEIDSGLSRCGIQPRQAGALAAQITTLEGLLLAGAFTHGGQIYGATNRAELAAASGSELDAMVTADSEIAVAKPPQWHLSVGSTPAALSRDRFPGVTEIRPGNYVFLDAIQVSLGVAEVSDCALTVAATVMSRPSPDRAVIDAGAKSLGLDMGVHGSSVISDYGALIGTDGKLIRLSEEHGVLRIPTESPLDVGDRVRILPNHACSVANLHARYFGLRGDAVEREIPIDASQGVH
jgi:D-serine deaminase-like pyridoxal phosphate-dependent protein